MLLSSKGKRQSKLREWERQHMRATDADRDDMDRYNMRKGGTHPQTNTYQACSSLNVPCTWTASVYGHEGLHGSGRLCVRRHVAIHKAGQVMVATHAADSTCHESPSVAVHDYWPRTEQHTLGGCKRATITGAAATHRQTGSATDMHTHP